MAPESQQQKTSAVFGGLAQATRWALIGACLLGSSSNLKACNEVIVLDPKARAGLTSSATPTPTATVSATATPTATPTVIVTVTVTPTAFPTSTPLTSSITEFGATPVETTRELISTGLGGSGTTLRTSRDEDAEDELGGGIDSDRDGLSDDDEATYGTDLRIPDSDGDGYLDGYEVLAERDPADGSSVPNGDIVPTNMVGPDADPGDRDGDGLLNVLEDEIGTDPNVFDTDGDGVPDGSERLNGSSPTKANRIQDSDLDGLSDELEAKLGTDGSDADSDHDGLPDTFEILFGLDPQNPSSAGGIVDGRLPYSVRNYKFKNTGIHINQ